MLDVRKTSNMTNLQTLINKPITEPEARDLLYCLGCGKSKDKGLVVCWDCFKYRQLPFKYHTGTLSEWLQAIKLV